ncbi:hypothetical protein F4604DRAFT_1925001 [Suillus subluteus]|nr:hypothetical protein F4604DRAFT_1925001 [Suillus subluteus]
MHNLLRTQHEALNIHAQQEVTNVSGTSYSNKLLLLIFVDHSPYGVQCLNVSSMAASHLMVSKHIHPMASNVSSMAASHLVVSVSFIIFKPYSVSVFTEDAYATQDRTCEWPSCAILIRAGEPCLYVATINPGQAESNVKETDNHSIVRSHYSQSSYNLAISQCRTEKIVNPPPVVAVSDWTNASMGPPPMSHRPHCTSGPNIAIPTSWHGSAVLATPSRLTGPVGYSSHHGMYAAEHQRWSKAAYSTPTPITIVDTISLEISAIHEAGGRKKKNVIANICEGKKDIDACMDTPGLIRLALDTVLPKLHTFADSFAWCDEEFTCMQLAQGAGKSLIFKTKQFPLMVVVPESQWREFELWQEESEAWANQLSQLSANVVSSVPQVFATATGSATATSQLSTNSVPVPMVSAVSATTVISIKRTHEWAISSTSSTTSPPRKSGIPPALQLCSPDRDQLKQVLKIGGGADLNVKQVGKLQNENIHFYLIPT